MSDGRINGVAQLGALARVREALRARREATMADDRRKLDDAWQAFRNILDAVDAHPGAHACGGPDCSVCRPDRIRSLARVALERLE